MEGTEPEAQRQRHTFDPLFDPEERRVLYAALDSLRQYRHAAHYNITHLRRQAFYSLPSAHIDILSDPPFNIPTTFAEVDDAIDCNADLAESILEVGLPSIGIGPNDNDWHGHATPNDMDKARSTLRQLYRDWSAEGLPERHASYSPLIEALSTYLPNVNPSYRHQCRVLVPGAGLGRLVLDICAAGYNVEGNEISYHQLLASNYILNRTTAAGQHKLYPWALNFSNHLNRANQLRCVAIPDVRPAEALERSMSEMQSVAHYSERMCMTAGDFCQVYKGAEYKDAFSAVVTCFFIDTAPNVIRYVETIQHCLRPDGIWANIGPLVWHFESGPTPAEKDKQRRERASHDASSALVGSASQQGRSSNDRDDGIGEPGSFELSNDEVIALLERFGFEIIEHKQAPTGLTGYIQDPTSMLQNVYRPAFWVARKG